MTTIINQWIQTRLGIIMNWDAEIFCSNTRDGHLLTRMLRSYEIINDNQSDMIHKTDVRKECMDNFQHITKWLEILGISLNNEELMEIVDCTGLGSINIFYKLFLELHDKDNLTFITQRRMNEKLHPQNTRFSVKTVDSMPHSVRNESKYQCPWIVSYDMIHWHQDRLEMLVNKCKLAKEEYMSMVRMREKRLSSSFSFYHTASPVPHKSDDTLSLFNESAKSVDLPYETLIQEKNQAKNMKLHQSNPEEAKIILQKYKAKLEKKAENSIFQKQLHKEVLNSFWERIRDEEDESCDKDIIEKLIKQSLYEKQMLRKLGEVKFQKEVMIQNKLAISDAIAKENEAEFFEKLLEESKELNEKEFLYYLNKEHSLKLHRKIYEAKLRLKSERLYKMCTEIVSNITDMACHESEYKEFFGELPSKRVKTYWMHCLASGEDIYDAISPVETILKPAEEIPEELETIVHYEIERQDKLDEKDFEDYLNFEWPWELENIQVDDNDTRAMNYGMNILGNIVHRLLLTKYPLPELPRPPEMPKIKISVCINGLRDTSCLPLLQKMLNHQEILVIEMKDVVNFCISAYKEEMKPEEDDDDEIEDTYHHVKESHSKKTPRKGAKSKSKSKISESTKSDNTDQKLYLDKKVQSPKVFPCEGVSLSAKAELGKIAEEQLSQGSSLTDHLLVHMFLEFLRPKNDLKGWVLVNYPVTLDQAILLEESLTGVKVPGFSNTLKLSRSIDDITEIELKEDNVNVDVFEQFRKTKLLDSPPKESENQLCYDSALTAFIKIIRTSTPNDTNTTLEDQDVQDRVVTPLEIFYSDMGCNYSLYYEKFDYYTIKSLGKLIIGDYSIPPKTSIELFGDTIRYIDAEEIVDMQSMFSKSKSVKSMKKGEKKEQQRIEKIVKTKLMETETKTATETVSGKKKKKEKLRKSVHSGHVLIVHEDKFTQIPEVFIEEIEEEDEENASIEPGGPGWKYINLKLPFELQVALATLWENAEEVYIGDFRQVMFMTRIILNAIIPKVNYVKNHINACINSPDDKQMYLRKFQQIYNEFDADIRSDSEFKAELHCRVNELRDKLIGVCDQQMAEAEQARCFVIHRKLCPRQLIELINNYINGFQLEIDRYVDTLTLVCDYYAGIVTKMPLQETMAKEALARFDLLDATIEESICDVLVRIDEDLRDPCHEIVEGVFEKALAFSNKCESWAWSSLEKIKTLFSPMVERGKDKQNKKNKSVKSEKGHPTIFEPNDDVKENSEKLFEEWKGAVNGEYARLLIRFKLLKFDMEQKLQQTLNTFKTNMFNIFEAIRSKYRHELDMVYKVCNFLSRAIEAEVPLQEELVFRDGEFYLNTEIIFFPDAPVPELSLAEIPDGSFNIPQLEDMTDILFDLAPGGYVPERIFVYLLQDMVTRQEKDMTPVSWSKMTPEDVTQLSERLFRHQELISWKDFILYNFMVPFPTAKEILRLRKDYSELDSETAELINEEQFYSVDLWFESDPRVELIKRLIFKIFRVNQEYFNYTAMLVHFCKADDIQEGIAKALTLSLGKEFCWDNDVGDSFRRQTLERRKIHEEEVQIRNEERRQNQEFSESIMLDVIDQVVHQCDSVVIEDLPDAETNKHSLQETRTNEDIQIRIDEDELKVHEKLSTQNINDNEITTETEIQNTETFEFSNLEIGFENSDHTDLTYFITLDNIRTILLMSLPSALAERLEDSYSENLENIFEECKDAEFDNEVFCHVVLNNPKLLDLLDQSFNFQIKNPPKIVSELLKLNEKTSI